MDTSQTSRRLNRKARPNQTFEIKLPKHHDCSHGHSQVEGNNRYNMRQAVSHNDSIWLVCLNCGKAESCWVA